jgi:hypothetical protein
MKHLLILVLFVGCQKKTTAPSSTTQTTNSKVYCWYQMGFNNSFIFYKCTSTDAEYQATSNYGATNQMNLTVIEKNSCNECQ